MSPRYESGYNSTGENAALIAAGTALADPVHIAECAIPFVTVPDGYSIKSLEHLQEAPARKRGGVSLADALSFAQYVIEHTSEAHTHLYADVDYDASKFKVLAVLDDHATNAPAWQEHKAYFTPVKAKEWRDWTGRNGSPMSQSDFAQFIEDHLTDIVTTDAKPAPSAAEMLAMALNFQHNATRTFKKQIDLNNGGVTLEFQDKGDDATTQKMTVFSRFTIGIPVFDLACVGTTAEGDKPAESIYPIEARLKYRQKDTGLVFWFELIRPDRVFKVAVDDQIKAIQQSTGLNLLRGWPTGARGE